ncbi:MAG: secondary thiamine-phosphate synthase enzyme YjbQ [Thermoanaerobaculum sp.]|nr:secondary thiamine-phosphate synthase enzyme YjbQ [Thermoanaerobaculum sp.]MCX7894342.1 secondary thiamine-phosphate synthase enzyme YjbQ [Thermoanaerobaculum sp.]MDW7968530.1 secondary thiamine-phosphate synthase enzyme YjbQ [Thermoanaerobaculum sp.]
MDRIHLQTNRRRELVDITAFVNQAVGASGVEEGLCLVYVPHTTAGVLINEGADPAVGEDILNALGALLPAITFRHREGNADAHVLASLLNSSVVVPIAESALQLGTWQAIFFVELDGPRRREVRVTCLRA